MSSTQPEALRLAELMDYLSTDSYEWWQEFDKCATELRRLYAEVDRLSYQLAYPDNFVKEPEQEPAFYLLEALNAAEDLLHRMGMQSSDAYQQIDAAIVKATKEEKHETH